MAISTNYDAKSLFLNSQTSDTSTTKKKTDPLGKDAFLTMMVAQLKHQDPLNPQDGTNFTAQLAQFSSLEQEINMNTNLSSILSTLSSSSKTSNVFDYIGKTISSEGNPVAVSNGKAVSGGDFVVTEPSKLTTVIYDSNGKAVRTMSSGTEMVSAGTYNIDWDGKDDNGYSVLDGNYTYKVTATNSKNQISQLSTTTKGVVSGITNSSGKSYLVVNGNKVDPDNVETISLTASSK